MSEQTNSNTNSKQENTNNNTGVDLSKLKNKLGFLKILAKVHHEEMLRLQKIGQENSPDYKYVVGAFNALSCAIGLTNAVGSWRTFEVNPSKGRHVTPLQRKILYVHRNLIRLKEQGQEQDQEQSYDR